MTVMADSTEDLLNVYGLTLGGPIKSEIERQMESLERDMLSMQTEQMSVEQYNTMLSQYTARRQQFIDDVLNDVSVYQSKNEAISNEIENSLLDLDLSVLLTKDSQYKNNTSYINELLSAINEYKIDYSYRSIDVDLSDVEVRLAETKQLYIDSIDAFDLGKVKDIDFVLPTDRVINSPYGYRQDPINRSSVRLHSGTDYRATTGTDIYALFNGVVISCGWSNTIGNFVTIQSGENVKYMVCHCSELLVSENQIVRQGDPIARVGGTGSRCTGPHLHMALYINGSAYDVDRLFK